MRLWQALRCSPSRHQILARALRSQAVVSTPAARLVRQHSTAQPADNAGEQATTPRAADSSRRDPSTSNLRDEVKEPWVITRLMSDKDARGPEQDDIDDGDWLAKPGDTSLLFSTKALAAHDGTVNSQVRKHLPYFWLRDNCRCSKCVNQDTMQRNFDTFAIPETIQATEAKADSSGVAVTWSDGHESFYDWEFLKRYTLAIRDTYRDKIEKYWGSDESNKTRAVHYREVMDSELGVAKLTWGLKRYGYQFVTHTPYDDPDHTRQLLERIAFIRQTHYGGFYDFTPDLAMADTAYTNLALPPHTDTTYFTDPAGLQAFHMLSHEPAPGTSPEEAESAASGGQSLLVDGFHAADVLKWEDREAWKVLTQWGVRWHASGNEGIAIAPAKPYPVLELNDEERVFRVRWNNDDRGVVPYYKRHSPTEWYNAARKFDEILKRKEMQYWVQLKPGRVLIFDNYRVLHGRSAFTGIRRICGGYINRDDFISRFRNSNFERPDVFKRVIG